MLLPTLSMQSYPHGMQHILFQWAIFFRNFHLKFICVLHICIDDHTYSILMDVVICVLHICIDGHTYSILMDVVICVLHICIDGHTYSI